MKILLVLSFIFSISFGYSQPTPGNGVEDSKAAFYILKNATIYFSPSNKMENAMILIQGDKIIKAGKIIIPPKEAIVIDCKGKTILPAFIELNTNVGLPKMEKKKYNPSPQIETSKKGAYYWNEAIHPEINASAIYTTDVKANKELVLRGFGFALTRQIDGIAQGSGAFVSLGEEKSAHLTGLTKSSFFSFQKGVSRQTYPSSQMGSIALLRQSFYDANSYKANHSNRNLSLEAINYQFNGQLILSTRDKLEILRAQKIAEEFNLSFNYIGSGNEYEVINELDSLHTTIILPINFPAAYDVKNPYISRQIPLSDLKHWELAPMNPAILSKNNIPICISSTNHKTAKEFWGNLRKAISHGLTEEEALQSLTLEPAKTIGVDNELGTLEKGKFASFIIYDGNPFKKEAKVLESWLMGKQTIYNQLPEHDIAGKYNILIGPKTYPITIEGTAEKPNAKVTYKNKITNADTTITGFIILDKSDITIQFIVDDESYSGSVSLRGKVNSKLGIFEGSGLLPNGEWTKWSAIKNGKVTPKKKETTTSIADTSNNQWIPNMAYGFETTPKQESIVIRNATLWTNEEAGIIKDGTIIIQEGKITFAGKGSHSVPNGARIIDAKGMHVTSGIIDEHSHIAISKGVNESGQAVSAEVSIGDVVNPDDINIYRQLSGGVTASQLLHGSANPIGGQSALIKLKWGHPANEMLIDNAPKFIKFALGENVKQSNWGAYNSIRFPQTRMGVEQLYYDAFIRARKYSAEQNEYNKDTTLIKPRVDIELEVLNQILNSERFISCHSYVQSEINMLMHVADSMGFKINTFTHILEGYKLADKMVEHGAGGSTFSDWWAYKYEVNDAIPYNAAIMHEQGVVVAINSDDAEMGRRLNQEAAKTVKYGNVSEIEAWKMVTLNPAKLLHLDDRMGSLKVGKDADVVIWTDNPLSVIAKVEYTIIDGEILYSSLSDVELRKRNDAERARIINKMLIDNKKGGAKKPFIKKRNSAFHCNTIGEELSTGENHH